MAPKRGRGKAMKELIPPSPMRAKKGRSQARPSQQCGQSLNQPQLSRPSQHTTLDQTQQQPPITRRTQSQLETQLQQNPSASSHEDGPLATPLDKTGKNQSEGIKKGRGAALSISEWGTGTKVHIKEYSKANKANRAHEGAPHRTGRTSFAQLKHEMGDKGEKTDQLSMFIKTRTKKTKNDDKDLFDEESGGIINQFNQCLEEREEQEQDEDYREEVFTRVMGPDAHRRVRMYGTGITPSQVFGQSSRSSNVNEDTI